MSKKVMGFGEVMLRLSAPSHERILQSKRFEATFGGSECNVMVSLANMGMDTGFVTLLPHNELTDAFSKELKSFGVDTHHIYHKEGRFGVYYVEHGSDMRGTKVIYDRNFSSMALGEEGDINWDGIFAETGRFHISGITFAISPNLTDLALSGINKAYNSNIPISLDLNYRGKLWKYGKEPQEIMPAVAKMANVIIGTAEDYEKCLGIKGNTEEEILRKTKDIFPNAETLAIITVEDITSFIKGWKGSMLFRNKFFESEQRKIYDIADGIGGGDAFSAGLIYGIMNFGNEGSKIINYASVAGLMKYTFLGDYNLATAREILSAMEKGGNIDR